MDFSMESNKQVLLAIQLLLEQKIGIKKHELKFDVLRKALEKRCSIIHIKDMKEYHLVLLQSADELQALIELLVIPETWFFRDREVFTYLVDYVKDSRKPCRLLSIPCSSGEEPYSIVISLLMAKIPPNFFKIDAVDISSQAIAKAKRGDFDEYSFRGSSLDFRFQYFDFDPLTSNYVIRKHIRDQVSFIQGNIFDDSCIGSLGSYDVILCRNLLIYLNSNARQKLLQILRKKLLPDGILIVSSAEIQIAKQEGFTAQNTSKLFVLKPQILPTALKTVVKLKPAVPSTQYVAHNDKQQSTILQEAIQLADKGLLENAEQLCRTYIKELGDNTEAYFILGTIEHARNMSDNAEQFFFKAIHLNPNHYEALIYLALIAESRGDASSGAEFRERAKKALELPSVKSTKLKGLFS